MRGARREKPEKELEDDEIFDEMVKFAGIRTAFDAGLAILFRETVLRPGSEPTLDRVENGAAMDNLSRGEAVEWRGEGRR